jgi:uncharacterized protein
MPIISQQLLNTIKTHYSLPWFGTHGIVHWSRVYENGILLAEQAGVQTEVVQLFAVFHDSQRENEHRDPAHGSRGAELALKLRQQVPLDDDSFALLQTACRLHTAARDHDNITVQACFDADRLDLGRVGTYPDPDLLCTAMAKDAQFIDQAYQRSLVKTLSATPFGITNGFF